MKPKETYVRCEYCDKLLKCVSPPTKEQYENAQILILEGSSILLPDNVATNGHSASIAGVYCGPDCLRGMISDILKEPKQG